MPTIKKHNISICYETHGNSVNPCVILIAGLSAQLIYWPTMLIQGLVDENFYVVTFDNRDVGFSSYYDNVDMPSLSEAITAKQNNKAFKPPYTLNDMAQDIIVLMDQLNIDSAHIVGISMGGQISQIFAIEHPNRTLSLTCISSSTGDPDLPPPAPKVIEFFFKPTPKNADFSYLVNRHISQYKLYNHPDDFDFESVQIFLENAYRRAYHPEGNKRQLIATLAAKPRGELLKNVKIPSLIIHGDYDPLVPLEHGKYLAACLPNSQLRIFKKMGHSLPARIHKQLVELMKNHFCKKFKIK